MAPSTRASKRAALNLDTSNRTHQATTDNTEPSAPTAPKQTRDRAGHDISSDINASTQTAQEVKSRKRPAQAPREGGAPSKRQRKLRKQLKNVPPANPSTTLYTSPQRVGILCLPTELHQHVLSYTSARDAARYRRVCKTTNRLVVGSEKVLIRAYAGGALSRLKKVVNEFNGLEVPHDAESLLKALHVWTKRRGQFDYTLSLLSSFLKLMTHFFLKRDPNDQTDEDDRGATAITWADTARQFMTMLSYPTDESSKVRFSSNLVNQDFLDGLEVRKLLEYSKEPQSQTTNHPLSCQLWPEEKLEHMTFPIRSWRLTPILRHPTTFGLEVPQVRSPDWPFDEGSFDRWFNYLRQSDDHDLLAQPGFGNEKLVRYLRVTSSAECGFMLLRGRCLGALADQCSRYPAVRCEQAQAGESHGRTAAESRNLGKCEVFLNTCIF